MKNNRPDTDPGRRWSVIVLLLGVAATVVVVIGIWSASLALESSVAETKLALTEKMTADGTRACNEPMWADPESLTDTAPPDYFLRGPGRQTSSVDRLFEPRIVYREIAPSTEIVSPPCPWGYVVSDSPLPFIVRTSYGVFPGDTDVDDNGVPLGSAEGVRTYISLFSHKFYLNEWAVWAPDTPRRSSTKGNQ